MLSRYSNLALLGILLSMNVSAAAPPANGAATYDIMLHSSCCYTGDPILATEDLWHAFFEAPETPATSPGVTISVSTDLSLLSNFDMLYIAQSNADALSGADMTIIRNWTAAGGILVINEHSGGSGASAFAASFGASYQFTSISDPSGDNMVVTDAGHALINFPNPLDNTTLSNWGSSAHGAFSALGSAYQCLVDSVSGITAEAVLCAANYQSGSIILTGLDPECGNGCHDSHISSPGGTNSGSELWENFVFYNGVQMAVPVPATSYWALIALISALSLAYVFRHRRQGLVSKK